MVRIRKYAIVVISDENNVQRAKQVFSSAYFYGRWKGDFVLLTTPGISQADEREMERKGIFVLKRELLRKVPASGYHPMIFHKAYLFSGFFRQWESIIFMDYDMIVRRKIPEPRLRDGFYACRDTFFYTIDECYNADDSRPYVNLDKEPAMDDNSSFNSGFFIISGKEINANNFKRFRELIGKSSKAKLPDQWILNTIYKGSWVRISGRYNDASVITKRREDKEYRLSDRSAVLHFIVGNKPWKEESLYYRTWKRNLADFDRIRTDNPLSNFSISLGIFLERLSNIVSLYHYRADRLLGHLGGELRKALGI